MICPNCQTTNADGEQFCGACGFELPGAVPSPDTDSVADASAAPDATLDLTLQNAVAVATLSYGSQNLPLSEGSRVLIAREGTDKCTPDMAIASDGVSSTPVEVTVENGVIKVRDTGSSSGMRVVKYFAPGEETEIKPGEMIMLGDNLIMVS